MSSTDRKVGAMGLINGREVLLAVTNIIWSSLVVAPLVVLFWRGTWDILDELIFPEFPALDAPSNEARKEKSGLVSFLLGLSIRIVLDLAKFHLGEFLLSKPVILKKIGGLLYCAVYAFAGIMFWRGTWYLMKMDVGEKGLPLSIVLIGGVTVLVFSKISKTLVSTPLAMCVDSHENTFQILSYFQKLPSDKYWFVCDVLFTNLVVRLLIVFCWWSLWSLEGGILKTNYIGVKDSEVAYDSLLLGYFATFMAFIMDRMMSKCLTSKQYITWPLICLTTLTAFFASVNVWRGIWSFYDNLLVLNIPKEVDYLVSAGVGFAALAALGLSNTISNDHILFDSTDSKIVKNDFFGAKKPENNDEMIPILD